MAAIYKIDDESIKGFLEAFHRLIDFNVSALRDCTLLGVGLSEQAQIQMQILWRAMEQLHTLQKTLYQCLEEVEVNVNQNVEIGLSIRKALESAQYQSD